MFFPGAVSAMMKHEGENNDEDLAVKLKEVRRAIGGRLAYDAYNSEEQ